MRFVYGGDVTRGEMLERHHAHMAALLEEWKLRRAQDIARRRSAGYTIPSDSLTSEAEIAQASAHLVEVQRALVDLQAERMSTRGRAERAALIERTILAALELDPQANAPALARKLDLPERTVRDRISRLEAKGCLRRNPIDDTWIVQTAEQV